MSLLDDMSAFETNEEKVSASITEAMLKTCEELVKIVKSDKVPAEHRVEAAALVAAMHETELKVKLLGTVTDENIKTNRKMIDKLDSKLED